MPADILTTTANAFTGFHVNQELGVVRGIVVRSRSIVGSIGAGIQTLFGGNISYASIGAVWFGYSRGPVYLYPGAGAFFPRRHGRGKTLR